MKAKLILASMILLTFFSCKKEELSTTPTTPIPIGDVYKINVDCPGLNNIGDTIVIGLAGTTTLDGSNTLYLVEDHNEINIKKQGYGRLFFRIAYVRPDIIPAPDRINIIYSIKATTNGNIDSLKVEELNGAYVMKYIQSESISQMNKPNDWLGRPTWREMFFWIN